MYGEVSLIHGLLLGLMLMAGSQVMERYDSISLIIIFSCKNKHSIIAVM